ncbi:MAG TPA: M23 family metallopeptidase [Gemmatimonadaceae bacterium]|nr:M23 family metallopeptidase [Gemmatimonadaceae bacterium]
MSNRSAAPLVLVVVAVVAALATAVARVGDPSPSPVDAPRSSALAAPDRVPTALTAGAPGDIAAAEAAAALGGSLVVPVAGVSPEALRGTFDDRRGGGRRHEAIDIMAPRGTPVVSATGGRLLRLHRSRAGGLMVYAADTADRLILMYAHLDRYARDLVAGMPLRRGQLLGYVGSTGNASASAPHLHFAIARGEPSRRWWSGTAVDPFPLLAARRSQR